MSLFKNLLKYLEKRLADCIDNENYHRQAMKRYETEILSIKESIAELEHIKESK